MKSLILGIFITSILVPNSFSQTSIDERYFHELKGIEKNDESLLFYQMTKIESYPMYEKLTTDYLYRYNADSNADSLITEFGYTIYPIDGISVSSLEGYKPFSEDLVFIQSSFVDGHTIGSSISDTKSKFSIASMLIWITNANYSKTNNDTLYVSYNELGTVPIPLTQSGGIDQTFFESIDLYDYLENNYKDFRILDISSFNDSVGFAINDSGLVKSEDLFKTFIPLDFEWFHPVDFSETTDRLLFDADSTHIYSLISNNLVISDDYGNYGSWKQIDLSEFLNNPSHLINDEKVSGSLFIADSNSVYSSTNFGSTFNKLLDFDSEITGLYKKPNSEILYVLTRTDLYKVENGQPTSIKQLPVSRENEPEIPNTVTLHQNFPNPFNPSTTIQFELNEATLTKLTVYDVLGRKVREMVNEVRPAGTNTIQFDATNLASGIYLYRLEANGVVQTRRLTLIK